MTTYSREAEPDQAEQLRDAWREGYECACSDMGGLLRESMGDMARLTSATRTTRAKRYFEGWHDSMLEQCLMIERLESGKGAEPCGKN